MKRTAIVAGVGRRSGFGIALVSALAARGYAVVATTRTADEADALRGELAIDAVDARALELSDVEAVHRAVSEVEASVGPIGVCVHNAARLYRSPFLEADLESFREAWETNVFTALTLSRAVLAKMLSRKRGALLFTGATASVRGGPEFGAVASSKFALRGLAQSLAREFGPQGIHVAHVLIDGVLWGPRAEREFAMEEDACLDPDALAAVYVDLIEQPPSCWTHELDVRPFAEGF